MAMREGAVKAVGMVLLSVIRGEELGCYGDGGDGSYAGVCGSRK